MLASLPESERAAILADLTEAQLESLRWDWSFWARPDQIEPIGSNWNNWLILAGRGYGKTRTGAEWVRQNVCGSTPLAPGRYKQIALIAETAADAREVMVGDGKIPGEGSGLLQVHPKDFRPIYEPSKRRLTWPNGAIATLYNATEPDQLRGPQHDAAWCDELAKWQYAQDSWDQLQFGLRLGDHPRVVITTTPRPIPLIRKLLADGPTKVTRGSTMENAANLPPTFIASIQDRYAGTRLGRQELNAEVLDDIPGALWTRTMIDHARKRVELPEMQRIVVSIDPSGTAGEEDAGDPIGIIVAGKGIDGRGYVLADRSCKLSPDGWGKRAVKAYYEFLADRIVAERNFGGAMVEHVIRTVDKNVPYVEVVASRGKAIRAEPVAALYEQKRITHIGDLAVLEDQMCAMTSDGYGLEGSPDRLDAAVWAISYLMFTAKTPIVVSPEAIAKSKETPAYRRKRLA
ncbi:terminase family protein [Bradyrhizobium sp. LjRoot220]|uniref:DNA-packaging protein n=1 Tax=Bradyrhizobium sp. LjRoot220 TaxID=3342284 RepID=UPI003ED07846